MLFTKARRLSRSQHFLKTLFRVVLAPIWLPAWGGFWVCWGAVAFGVATVSWLVGDKTWSEEWTTTIKTLNLFDVSAQ